MTIKVGLGTGSKAQQFAQTMALANVQKELIAGGKTNLVGDRELYNTAAELTRIMGHKNPDMFFNDPEAKNPVTGQLLHPAPTPPVDPKVLQVQAQAQNDQAELAMKAQLDQQKAQNDLLHQQIKTQAELALAKVKAELDAKLKMIDAHMKTVAAEQAAQHARETHQLKVQETALGIVQTAHAHETKMEQARESKSGEDKT
jgi:hypothetical protein